MLFGPCEGVKATPAHDSADPHRVTQLAHSRCSPACSPSSPALALASPDLTSATASASTATPPHPAASASAPLPAPALPLASILAPTHPDLADGLELESLPLWASLLGLLAANVAGLALTIAVLRMLQDGSEPLTVVKVQVAMLERRPQLQSKLAELSSMIQMGQQGTWLILEEAILQLLQHQSTVAYGAVSAQQLVSKKRAYAAFGAIAEAEAAKANREEAIVRHIGETVDEELEGGASPTSSFFAPSPSSPAATQWSQRYPRRSGGGGGAPVKRAGGGGGGLWSGLMGGLGLGPAAKPPKELTVVTLVVAARGTLNIDGKVTDWPGLRQALQQLTGLSSDRIMAVELLWTPRKESDYLTRSQLERDYPDLVPLGPMGGVAEPSGSGRR